MVACDDGGYKHSCFCSNGTRSRSNTDSNKYWCSSVPLSRIRLFCFHPPPLPLPQATRFVEFLESVTPCKVKHSKKLVGQDDHSNVFNYKYTTHVELVPVCKDDLVLLPYKLAQNLGDLAR